MGLQKPLNKWIEIEEEELEKKRALCFYADPAHCSCSAKDADSMRRVTHLVDSNQPGYELHHHDLHLKALLRAFQLLQEFLREIFVQKQISDVNCCKKEPWSALCAAERWDYLAGREWGEWQRNWTLPASSFSCVSAQKRTKNFIKLNKWQHRSY